jgi:head-tail adaptor
MTLYHGKKFVIGSMRHRILVQQEAETFDETSGQATRTWSTLYANEPSIYDEVRGGESFRGGQVEAGVSAVFTVRYREGYGPQRRIYFNLRYYNIVFAKRVRGYDRYLEIHCRAVDNEVV